MLFDLSSLNQHYYFSLSDLRLILHLQARQMWADRGLLCVFGLGPHMQPLQPERVRTE